MRSSDQLAAFVGEALRAGRGRDEIAGALARAGWSGPEIAAALDAWADTGFDPPVPRPRPVVSAREAFVYALLFVALAVTAWHVTALGFALIELWLPEVGETRSLAFRASSIRWSVAFLVVFFPLFLLVDARLRRAEAADPGHRRSAVRKWFGYAILFLASLALLGDLIAVIYAFLSGDMTARFAAKAALVALVAGLVLLIFRAEIGDARGPAPRTAQAALSVLVVAVVGAALVTTGGPGSGRAEQRDLTRLRDLDVLSSYVQCVANARGALPQTLEDVPACRREMRRADPHTGAPYRYLRDSDTAFRVCAEFEAPARLSVRPDFDAATGCLRGTFRP